MTDKPDTPPAEPPVTETIFEKQDRVLHDMGNPQPKESKQWLREYAAKMLEAALATAPNEAPQGAPETMPHELWTATCGENGYRTTDRRPEENVIRVCNYQPYTLKTTSDARIRKLEVALIEIRDNDKVDTGTRNFAMTALKTDTQD